MKKAKKLWIVGLVLLYICLVTEIILTVIDFSLPLLIYVIGLFVFTVSDHFILFVINRIIRETKESEITHEKTKKEIISEMGGVIKEFTRQNVNAETVDGFVEVNKFIEDYINEL